jgi:hypothetical protein
MSETHKLLCIESFTHEGVTFKKSGEYRFEEVLGPNDYEGSGLGEFHLQSTKQFIPKQYILHNFKRH